MRQLDLPLGYPDPGADVFIVGEANARAVQMLEHRGAWPVMAIIITGPRKSGRSRLARVFAARSGGTMIDDAEGHDEAALFHAWNAAQAQHKPLFIVADAAPPEWRVRLPDLRSRLAATPVVRIAPPDDVLLGELLAFQLQRHEIVASGEVVSWLSRRIDRSYIAILRVIDRLEEAVAARRGRRLSIPVARATLQSAGLLHEPSSPEPDKEA